MEKISENKNTLFKRQEMVLSSDKNLSFEEAKKEVAGIVGKDESVVDIRNVKGGFGNQKFEVVANVYDSKEDLETMKNMELSKKKKKDIEEQKASTASEDAAGADAPAEEDSGNANEENAEGESKDEDKVEEESAEEPKEEEKVEESVEEEKKEDSSE